MAWAIVNRVFRTNIGESSAAKAVLLSLANHCDEQGGSCFPSQDAIQAETGLSLDTIQRQLPILEKGGWITRRKRPGVRGRWWSWAYQINVEKLVPPGRMVRPGHQGHHQAAPCGFTGPHGAVSPGRTMRLKPILKPINEPSRARETEPAPDGPRGLEGLGPLGAQLQQRIDPAAFEAWFVKGEAGIVSQTADTVTIAVKSRFFAQQIGNRFEADLVACSGAVRIELVVRQ